MTESLLSQNESILSKEVREISNNRLTLIEKLGRNCILCHESDTRIIHVDHKYGQGYLEKHYFESREKMYQFYVDNFEKESKHLQLLCFNCNTKKRIENSETAGRKSIEVYYSMLMDSSKFDPNTTAQKIDEFLTDNPQFIPVHERLAPNMAKLLRLVSEKHRINQEMKQLEEIFPKQFNSFFQQSSSKTDYDTQKLIGVILDIVKESQQENNLYSIHTLEATISDTMQWSRKHVMSTLNKLVHDGILIEDKTGGFRTV